MTEQEAPFVGKVVAQSVRKVDSLALAQGKPLYAADFVADLKVPPLIAKILWSPHAHARIKKIDTSRAEALDGVHCVLTYENIPRLIHTTAGQGYPEPSPYDSYILDNKVRFVGDRVAAVAAVSEQIAEEALRLIHVEYDVLPAILDPEKALDPNAPVIHDEPDAKAVIPVFYDSKKNHVAHTDFTFGDVEAELQNADFTFERKFKTHYAQHCPIEPHVCLAYYDSHDASEHDRIIVRTSTQVPFHARRIIAQALDIPMKQLRVIKPRIGGGFGTKQEVLLEPLVVLLCLRTRKPVLLEYSRKEEFISARTRHPYTIWLRSGVKKDGSITAVELKVLSNTGAYGSHGLTVMSNAGSKTLPLYHMNAVGFIGDTVYTNLPVAGAYRGYGATQAAFALEVLIDEMAEAIGMDPAEFRLKNHIRTGETSPVFKALGEGTEGVEQTIQSCGLSECITRGMEAIQWKEKRGHPGEGVIKRGVGMATLMQGSSIPKIDLASASAKMNDDGSFNLYVGATDLGTGSDTVLAQIFAEVLGISVEDVLIYSSDTDMTPFDKGAYASSTTYLSGTAVKKVAEKIKEQIITVAARLLNASPVDLELGDKTVRHSNAQEVSFAEICKSSLYSEDQFQIGGIASHVSEVSPPPFAAHFAEIEVDTETGQIIVVKYVAVVDCGTPINPRLAEGQIEGAVMNGISYTLTEEFLFNEKGRMLNPSFDDYYIFTTADMPELVTILVPTYEPTGPFGAKSVAEIGINGPMPAIANAIYDAVGIRLRTPPFTPEKILAALNEKERGGIMD
ncbi:MAG: xanthine dehydrogenase family protein molybdopterin-binding subunit [Candidatus Hodarchaeales archaeon]|jgi:probable selenate reductase molybdenum-binding subunit